MSNLSSIGRFAFALSLATVPLLASDGNWNFGVGLTYASGLKDVKDFYAGAYSASTVTLSPVGAAFMSFYEWKNGFRFFEDVGPVMVAMGDVRFVDVPVGLSAGYVLLPSQDTSPYVRAGIRDHIASGDRVESSTPGAFAALGVDFARRSGMPWGIEAAIDTSLVKFKSSTQVWNPATDQEEDVFTKIKPNKLLLNVHLIF